VLSIYLKLYKLFFNKQQKKTRDDFIQYMIDREEDTDEAEDAQESALGKTDATSWNSKHLKKKLTNAEIISQSVLFLMAGYETTASTLEFISYHLAKYPQVQQNLCDEIDQVLDKHVNLRFYCYIK
jgi:cytochrome P450 family 3 subfamily A